MNAILQTSDSEDLEKADWLALSMAYLTILGGAPSLKDLSYTPGPNEQFQRYTVPGLLSEVPILARMHLLAWVACAPRWCDVRFYYRTETFDPFEKCTFRFESRDGKLRISSARVVEGPRVPSKKKRTK